MERLLDGCVTIPCRRRRSPTRRMAVTSVLVLLRLPAAAPLAFFSPREAAHIGKPPPDATTRMKPTATLVPKGTAKATTKRSATTVVIGPPPNLGFTTVTTAATRQATAMPLVDRAAQTDSSTTAIATRVTTTTTKVMTTRHGSSREQPTNERRKGSLAKKHNRKNSIDASSTFSTSQSTGKDVNCVNVTPTLNDDDSMKRNDSTKSRRIRISVVSSSTRGLGAVDRVVAVIAAPSSSDTDDNHECARASQAERVVEYPPVPKRQVWKEDVTVPKDTRGVPKNSFQRGAKQQYRTSAPHVEDNDDCTIPTVPGIFCGYRTTGEERARLKSAHP